jgi:hypothetical protein
VKIEARSDRLLPFAFLFADDLHPIADRGLRSGKNAMNSFFRAAP